MDTPERPERRAGPLVPLADRRPPAAAGWVEPAPEAAAPRMFSPRMIARALRRHWWQILAIWLVGSAGLGYLAYTKIRPSYDATAWLNVEPPARRSSSRAAPASTSAPTWTPRCS